jgi:hypothetical protein
MFEDIKIKSSYYGLWKNGKQAGIGTALENQIRI